MQHSPLLERLIKSSYDNNYNINNNDDDDAAVDDDSDDNDDK